MDDKNFTVTRTSLQDLYKQVHIERKEEYFEKLKEHGRKYLSTVTFEHRFVILAFEELLKEIISRTKDRKAEAFLEIGKGFLNLEQYGIKLLVYPWRKEFQTIKLYSSYFKHKVETAVTLPIASPILQLYGYKEKSHDVLELKQPTYFDSILATAFDLFLSSIELEVLHEIAKEVELYNADNFTLEDIIKSRVKTNGDVEEAKYYLFNLKGISSDNKRIRLDGDGEVAERKRSKSEANYKIPSTNYALNSSTRAKVYSDNNYSKPSKSYSSGNARVEHISSSNGLIGMISDNELYGIDQQLAEANVHAAPTITNFYPQPMETEYREKLHMDYREKYDDYEDMSEVSHDNNYLTMNALLETQGLPPPTYGEADPHFPGNIKEWVVIEGQEKGHDNVSNAIPGMSGLNIGENGTHFNDRGKHVENGGFILSSKQERKSRRSPIAANFEDYPFLPSSGGIREPLTRTTTTTSTIQVKGPSTVTTTNTYSTGKDSKIYQEKIDVKFKDGFEMRQAKSRASSETTGSAKELHGKTYENGREMALDPNIGTTSSKTSDNLSSSSLKDRSSFSTRDRTTSNQILTPPTEDTEIPPMVLEYRQKDPSKDYTSEEESEMRYCVVCANEATDMCGMCGQVCCEKCIDVLNKRPCGEAPSHHVVKKTESSSKRQDQRGSQENCAFCGKPSTHECQICKTKSCGVCHHIVTNNCKSTIGHVFRPCTTSEPSLYSEMQKDLNETNICDFCRLTAAFICADCHNRICKQCMKFYDKDLCPKTKKAHYFQRITVQTRIDPKEKGWSCERCTYSNPPHNRICAMCATSRGVTDMEYVRSGSRKCASCTYGNKEGASICAMCSKSLDQNTAESYI